MNAKSKIQELVLITGIILAIVVSIVVLSSKKELSVSPQSQAATITQTPTPTTPVTIKPTSTLSRAQDVPLTVLGSTEEESQSYLYTELASKGIISNVGSTTITLLWLTEAPQSTALQYGFSDGQLNKRFVTTPAVYIHEARLSNLLSNTTYFYSGPSPVTDTFITPRTLSGFPVKQQLRGSLTNNHGQCLVRVALSNETGSSTYATALTSTSSWTVSLTSLRTVDLGSYYAFNAQDTAEVDVLCIDKGKIGYSGAIKTKYGTALQGKLTIKLHRIN